MTSIVNVHSALIELATASKCLRMGVAAMLLLRSENGEQRISFGINAHPQLRCTGEPGACGCVHAEIRAIDSLRALHYREPIKATGPLSLEVHCTHAPCLKCAKALVDEAKTYSATLSVYFGEAYRIAEGADFLFNEGVKIQRTPPHLCLSAWQ